MKKNKDNSPDIYENIDRFLCHEMNYTEERNFLEKVSKEAKIHDKALLNVLMIKAILNKGKKADSVLLNVISCIQQDGCPRYFIKYCYISFVIGILKCNEIT